MSVQTGTELVSLALLLNKGIGVYGVIALFTGYAFSALQLSMFFYSVLIAIALAFLIPHIHRQSPFQNLALAWLYVMDTLVNAAYTTVFAVTWYRATFHDPAGPAGANSGEGAGIGGNTPPDEEQTAEFKAGVGAQETASSLVLIVALTLVRVYFSLVVMSFARMTIQKFVEDHAGWDGSDAAQTVYGNPFAVGSPLGEGWKGKAGRFMVSIGRGYWLGQKEDEEWTRDVGSKFKNNKP